MRFKTRLSPENGSNKTDNHRKQGSQEINETGQQPSRQHQGKKFADNSNNRNNWSVLSVLPQKVFKPNNVKITSVTPSAPVHPVQFDSMI